MPDIVAGTLIAGRYRLEARLDAGGLAQVWKAFDDELKREVAVKILVTPPGGDASFVDAFRAEAQIEASLTHPNIVEVFDWGHDDDANFVVMELLAGRTVRQRLDSEGPLDWQLVLGAGRQVSSALAYAHHGNTAHGNLDANTIMLAADGHATVIGFGLWCRDQRATPPAPDLDTYSLGGVMYEMLSGASPFSGRPSELPAEQPWPLPLRRFAPDAPADLDQIVMRAIAADPSVRYETAAELQSDLDALARPKSRAWLWVTLAVLAVLIAAGTTWLLSSQQNVVVPDVAGRSSAQADSQLKSAGLKMVVAGQVASASVPTDTIVSESPAAGQRVRQGSEIAVVVSIGLPRVNVPSIIGADLQTASSQVASAGLVVGKVTRKNSTTYPVDTVISSNPPAGEPLPVGTKIDIVVSAGEATVTMPDVRGISQANATAKLTSVGLKVDVGRQYSSQPTGRVVTQGPAPGSTVPAGATVTISVSQGLAPVAVPDVAGATKSDATTKLLDLGFVPVISTEASGTSPSQKGLVVGQEPDGGTSAPAGSKVTITIGD